MNDGKQNAETHGDQGPPENRDTNEKADEQVEILQPDGTPAPRAE